MFELFLFGSGRPLVILGVTARMIFFSTAMFLVLLFFTNGSVPRQEFTLISIFSIVLVLSSLIGMINGASLKNILSDILPLLYFFIVIFFSFLSKNDERFVRCWVSTLKKSSVVLTVLYFVFILVIFLGLIDFNVAYQFLSSDSNEIMFRGADSSAPFIFYKSFIFLVIGFFFFYYEKGKWNKLISSFIFIAILFTLTRGFILCVFVVTFFFIILESSPLKRIILVFLALLVIGYIFLFTDSLTLILKPESDAARFIQFGEVLDMINVSSIFIGHGYGIGTYSRPNNFEITYLEVFHKQGILGLFFWIFFLFYLSKKFWYLKNKTSISKPIYAGVLVIYVQTLTNPYLINSMGIGYLALAFVSLNSMSRVVKRNLDE
ncbi:O-antigen ligase family protein [Aeromonas veronii]